VKLPDLPALPDLPDGSGWVLLLALLLLWTLGAHNRITALKAAVLTAWQQVDAALQARAQALAALLGAVTGLLASEAAALDAVAQAQAQVQAAAEAVRRAPVVADTVADLGKADAVLAAVLVRLVALVEQQSALLGDPTVAENLKALRESPPRMAFARQVFNEAGAAYNAATTQFPTRLLGGVLRFGRAGRL
jgi:LemA protein